MNNTMIVQKLNEISKSESNQIIKQVFGSLIIGFTLGFPDELLEMLFVFNDKKNQKELNKEKIAKNITTITKLHSLLESLVDSKSKLIIGSFIVSISFDRLPEYRNILAHLNPQLQKFAFSLDTGTGNKTIH